MALSDSFLEALKKPRPDPGGGAAAAHGALMALCLLEKVAGLEKNRSQPASDARQRWEETLQEIHRAAQNIERLRSSDVEAYRILARTLKEEVRQSIRDDAAEAASRVPLAVMEAAAKVLETAAGVGRRCAFHLTADVAVAAELLGSAVQSAFWIALWNADLVKNPHQRGRLMGVLSEVRAAGEERLRTVREELEKRRETGSR